MPLSRRTFVAALAVTGACSKSPRKIAVGSKNTTEHALFGEIIALHLERRLGRPVERHLNLPGTRLAHDTLVGGGIDLYVEYSGAAFAVVIKEEPAKDQNISLERLKQEYSRSFLCDWSSPLGVDASYVVAVNKETAQRKHKTLSEAAEDKDGFRFGSSIEFQERPDGLPALSSYRLRWKNAPRAFENERLYRLFQDGLIDMIGVNATDGRLEKVEHVLLADDRQVFRPQLACIVTRQDAEAGEPKLKNYLAELLGKFNNAQMRDWNYKVDVMRRTVADVAKEFLKINP